MGQHWKYLGRRDWLPKEKEKKANLWFGPEKKLDDRL
jgi:hypothetical protein